MTVNGNSDNQANQEGTALSPEQKRQLVERVYQLLLQEVRINYERRRPQTGLRRYGQGGR